MTIRYSGFVRLALTTMVVLALGPARLPAAAQSEATPERRASAGLPLGQLLLVGFAGSDIEAGHPILKDIRERHLGGVVLFNYGPDREHPAGNITSPRQLRKLTSRLQATAAAPLLIAIDQEGGRICRLKQDFGFPPTEAAETLGRRNDLDTTFRRADEIARTLKDAGINLNLAPVVDVNLNPANPVIGGLQRSFSADPSLVTAHARQFIRAHHARGILCSLKHFPGHGSSSADSHKGFVDVTTRWSERELEPFRDLIEEGLADTVLTAHVFNARLDPALPATLSKTTIDGLLRGRLGFDGVVISDDLTMGAIADHYPLEEAVEKALHAGVDILLLADNRPDVTARMLAVLEHLVDSGRISRQRVRQSLQRIAKLKARLASHGQGAPCPNRQP